MDDLYGDYNNNSDQNINNNQQHKLLLPTTQNLHSTAIFNTLITTLCTMYNAFFVWTTQKTRKNAYSAVAALPIEVMYHRGHHSHGHKGGTRREGEAGSWEMSGKRWPYIDRVPNL